MPFKVGLTTRALGDPARRNWQGDGSRPIVTHLWYPAVPTADEIDILVPPEKPLFRARRAAPEAPLSTTPSRLPLVLLSHGTGGSAMAHAWLAARLAAHGYVVAGANHHGNTALEPYVTQAFARVWERPLDLSYALSALLADPVFGPRLDPSRVGAAGFSLGGYAALALAGARMDLRALRDAWQRSGRDLAAEMPPEAPDPAALAALFQALMESDAEHRQPFRDDRVRAAFAIAPALGEAFTPAGLAGVSIPALIVVGAADQAAPAAVNAAHFARHITGAELRLPDGPVAHYTFLSEATDAGRQTLPDLTLDPPGVDRAAVHHLVAGWALDFFNRTLG